MKWIVLVAALFILTQQKSDPGLSNQTVVHGEQTARPSSDGNKQRSDQDAQIQSKIKDFTGLLVAVGLLQCIVLAFQLWLIHRQDEHFRNSERAWVMAELDWYENGLHVVLGTGQNRDGDIEESTAVFMKLTCRNDGRSPAWIDNVYGRVEIGIPAGVEQKETDKNSFGGSGPMGPLGPSKEQSRSVELRCPGHVKQN
jgi:hypothetical protein